MKLITFLGDSLARLRDFPDDVRAEAGFQLREIQKGHDPADWKPFKTVGPGCGNCGYAAMLAPFG